MPSARRPARSLADDLRARSDAELVELLLARPDLARPTPSDLTALAARSTTRASTQRALERLDTAHLQLLEALLAAGSPADPVAVSRLLDADPPAVAGILTDLIAQALVWRVGPSVAVSGAVADLLGPRPGGLWPGLAALLGVLPRDLTGEARIAAVVAAAPRDARAVLDRLTWSSGALALDDATLERPGVRWLVEHRLIVPFGDAQAVLPREVALHLRGGRLHEHPALQPPAVAGTAHDIGAVDATAGAAAGEVLGQLDELLAAWGAAPPRVLRAGGLAVRDLSRLATGLDVPVERAAFVAELALAGGLVADDGALEPSWAPTAAADEWALRAPADRWGDVVAAWLTSPRAAHLVGSQGPRGTVNALGADVLWPPVRALRRDVLEALASRPAGVAVDAHGVVELMGWRRPLLRIEDRPRLVSAVLAEAQWLGVCGRGALSSAGRAALLATGADVAGAAAAEVGTHLPPAVTEIVLQADLTAIAPGRLEGPLAGLMRLVTDVESRGGATVHRFSDASVRRALDAGWTADDLLDALARASITPVPQPLDYLVQDVARRHGQLRVGSAAAYVRSEDPVLLDTILATPGLSPLRLRRLAPTVLVSPLTGDVVLSALRVAGLAPAAETEDGVVSVPAAPRRAVPRRRSSPGMLTEAVDADLAWTVVAALRAGQGEADERRAGGAMPASAGDPAVVLALLREAAADKHAVQVDYAGSDGGTSRLLLHPRRVEGGRVYGTTGASNVERVLSVHRIVGASLT